MAKGRSGDDGEKRRTAGAGSVDQLASGRWRVRVPTSDGKRRSLGVFDSEGEALGVLNAALVRLAEGTVASVGAITLRGFGTRWIEDRELSDDVRSIEADKSRWRTHIVTAPFFDWPIAAITPLNIADCVLVVQKKLVATPYRGERPPKKLSRKTAKEILRLLKLCFDAALSPHRHIRENPAIGIKVKKELRTHEPWTYLTLDEQDRLLNCEAIPEWDQVIMAFALGTGMRAGEQFNLELVDLRVDGDYPEVIVRFGSKGKPPKNGKIRHVPLFGLGLWAAKRWLELLPEYAPKNPEGLVFPGRRGGRRPPGKKFHTTRYVIGKDGKRKPKSIDVFREHLKAAGIVAAQRHDGRPVRWHDIRHTTASSLVAGWWGAPKRRRWSLIEARDLLGHSSVSVTEKYAHLAPSALREAAEETRGSALTERNAPLALPAPRDAAAHTGETLLAVVEHVAHVAPSAMQDVAVQTKATLIASTAHATHAAPSASCDAAKEAREMVIASPSHVAHVAPSALRDAAEQPSRMVVTGGEGGRRGRGEGHVEVINHATTGNHSNNLWGYAPNPAPASRSP
jgi:integrase